MFDVAGGVRCREDVAQRVATAIGRTQKGLRRFQATRATLLRNATARQAVAGVSAGGVSALSVISLRRNGISTTSYRDAIRDSRIATVVNKLVWSR